jgi:hypothetical protein
MPDTTSIQASVISPIPIVSLMVAVKIASHALQDILYQEVHVSIHQLLTHGAKLGQVPPVRGATPDIIFQMEFASWLIRGVQLIP